LSYLFIYKFCWYFSLSTDHKC